MRSTSQIIFSSVKQVGSNSRKASSEESKAAEEAEKLRKKEEMKKALADDEAALEGVKTGKVVKAKKKDDVAALLLDGLKKAPKVIIES